MLSYEQWDLIADSYIPLLLLFILGWNAKRWQQGREKHDVVNHLKAVGLSVVLIYLLVAIDNRLMLWAMVDADYSTHTALALVFVSYLSLSAPRWRLPAVLSLLAYLALMLFQRYHTVTDILLTAMVVIPLLVVVQKRLFRLA